MIEPTTSSIIAVTAAALLGLWTVLREIHWNRRFNRLRSAAVTRLRLQVQRELLYASITAPSAPEDTWLEDEFDLASEAAVQLRHELDKATSRLTSFETFDELVNAPGYTPTLNLAKHGADVLAAAYDKHKRAAGSGKRAHTYIA